MEKKLPRQMTGAELKSMLKSSINFKSLGGVKCEELTLPPEEKKWFLDCKVGLFVHWGLYSILGHGEWARFNEKIPKETYEALAEEFRPGEAMAQAEPANAEKKAEAAGQSASPGFHPQEWVELAKDFGARYMVMVTRHHDGFALWDSPASYESFTSFQTGLHRDYVKEYVEACRKAKLRVGLYYSLMDWRFPGYFDPEGLPENAALMKAQCYGQMEELCSAHHPDIVWYDGAWLAHKGSDTSAAWFWEPEKLNKLVRSHNPGTLINPRSGWEGDFYCDEGSHEIVGNIIPVPWEKNMCICSGCSWGWMAEDPVSDFDWLIRMLVNVVCRGGNWLVNIGPDRNGKVSKEIRERIHEVGEWLRKYGESIYETTAGPYEPVDGVYGSTFCGNTVYLHILDAEKFRELRLPKLKKQRAENASEQEAAKEDGIEENPVCEAFLFDGTKVPVMEREDGIVLELPTKEKLDEIAGAESEAANPDLIVILKLREEVNRKFAQIYFIGKE